MNLKTEYLAKLNKLHPRHPPFTLKVNSHLIETLNVDNAHTQHILAPVARQIETITTETDLTHGGYQNTANQTWILVFDDHDYLHVRGFMIDTDIDVPFETASFSYDIWPDGYTLGQFNEKTT